MSRLVVTFGGLAVLRAGEYADLGGPKPRLLLALLLSRANAGFRADELIDAVWAGRPPRTARKNLQVHVSRLRRVLGGRLVYTHEGYTLRLDPAECDLTHFEQLACTGMRRAREGDADTAVALLDEAVALWRCRPLTEFADVPFLTAAVDRLEELFLSALEEWAEQTLHRGGHRLVLERLQEHAAAHTLRERLAAVWMEALSAAGRDSEALAHFETVRRALDRELGVRPGRALSRLHARPAGGSVAARPEGVGNQLPRDIPDFVGRATEVHQAVEHLGGGGSDSGRVAVVSGPVGVGKTVFAVHVAHLLADAFPDGLLMVELGDRPTGAVLRALLEAAGLPAERSVAQSLARWRSWVAQRRLLLVLDDAVSSAAVRALLPGAGASAALVTSCYRLGALEGVTRFVLPPLSETEGTELLGHVLGFGRVMAGRPAVRRIVDACEGRPLALRITATRLDALRHVRLADFAERLCTTPCLLDEMTSGELVLRERYEAFWRGLTEPQRSAYRSLAVLPPPLRPDQVAAVEDELLECNLLTPPEGEVSAHLVSYGMSRFAREFGGEADGPRQPSG